MEMKKQKKTQLSWLNQLTELNRTCDYVLEMVDEADGNMSPDELRTLRDELGKVKRIAEQLHVTMCQTPVGKMIGLDRMSMTKQEYYFLCAAGAKLFSTDQLGISPVSDYQAFLNCCYEDDEKVCYINPAKKPPVEDEDKKTGSFTIRVGIGYPPEELHLKYLRPEQKEFFAKFLPDVLERFQQD